MPAARAHIPTVHYDEHGLFGDRRAARYNGAEQRYSQLLHQRIEQLLRGDRNELLLLRRYPHDSARLGAMPTPTGLDRHELRIDVVEHMTTDALVFLSDRSTGGPVAQECDVAGRIVETRQFPTRYPHIIIERIDVYPSVERDADYVEWRVRRVQNQRQHMQISRVLDVTNLSVDLARLLI
jgi:hypothetical protein